jgi:FkbM family methyltransferase
VIALAPPPLRLSLTGRAVPALSADDHLRVVAGPLRGARWLPHSGLHSCLEGTYEHENQELFAQNVGSGDVVFDVGANVGFFTLLASRLVGASGRVVAFEPFPAAKRRLDRHLELNAARNVTVFQAAVSDTVGRARFHAHADITMGRIEDEGELDVEVVRLDDLVQTGRVPAPDLIKIDVEGEEAKVLRGAGELLRTQRPTVLLATHGSAAHAESRSLLVDAGYELEPLPYDTTAPEFDFLGELVARPLPG